MRKLEIKRSLASVLMLLGLSASAWGYGLDGFSDSADFSNLMGPFDDNYPHWSWEGGNTDPNVGGGWSSDSLGNNVMSSYDIFPAQDTSYITDGDILTHVAIEDPQVASYSSGFYRVWGNHFYAPKGGSNNYAVFDPPQSTNDADGFTVEWRMKLRDPNTDTAYGLTNGYYLGWTVNECPNLYVRIGGYDNTDSEAKFPGGFNAPIADVTEWHTYRFAVLGDDGTGTIRANFYQDNTLVVEEMAVGAVGQIDANGRVLWCGTEWGSEIAGGQHTKQIDYVRVDTFGAYAPIPECGDFGYLDADLNQDCYVNLEDLAELGQEYLTCNNPADPGC
jgi:hypothetical protein